MSLNENLYYGANTIIKERAKELRNNMTAAEKALWGKIRNSQLGFKFRRQHPIDIFIADFYCHEKKLIVELDGEIHNNAERIEYDIGRTDELNHHGIKVIRYTNDDIKNCLEAVLIDLKKALMKRESYS